MANLFSDISEIQKQQLINAADPDTVSANIVNVGTKLNSIKNSYISNPVIDSENARLTTKNEQIQTIKSSQDRTNALNESYRKRNWEYVKLLIVVAISLFVILGISMFLRNIIPDSFIDLLTAIIIGIVLIYAFMTYRTISYRSAIDFDKLNLSNPISTSGDDAASAANQKIISAGESGDILGAAGVGIPGACSGPSCCDSGTKWCLSQNKCILNANVCPTIAPTTTPTPTTQGFTTMSNSNEYTESEYTNYAPYK
jgi:hypothetical protein